MHPAEQSLLWPRSPSLLPEGRAGTFPSASTLPAGSLLQPPAQHPGHQGHLGGDWGLRQASHPWQQLGPLTPTRCVLSARQEVYRGGK